MVYLSSDRLSLAGVLIATTAAVFWAFPVAPSLRARSHMPTIGIPEFLILPMGWPSAWILRFPSESFCGAEAAARRAARNRYSETKPRKSPVAAPAGLRRRGQHRQCHHLQSMGLQCRELHGHRAVLRPDLSRHAAGIHRSSELAPLSCRLRGLPYRSGRVLLREIQAGRRGTGVRGSLEHLPRPIPSPVANLRPARETCEQCHCPRAFRETYSPFTPPTGRTSKTTLFHRAADEGRRTHLERQRRHPRRPHGGQPRIEYISTDGHRQTIPQVTYTAPDGSVTVYNSTSAKAQLPISSAARSAPWTAWTAIIARPTFSATRKSGGPCHRTGPDQPRLALHQERGRRRPSHGISGSRNRPAHHRRLDRRFLSHQISRRL